MRVASYLIISLSLLLLPGCASAMSNTSEGNRDYMANCSTEPGGDNLSLLARVDTLRIELTYAIPCNVAPLCTGATFTSTMNTNQFFGPSHTLDEWGVAAGLGQKRAYTFSTADWEGTDRVILQVRSSATGEEILATCDFILTVDPRPQNPQLTSTSHDIGQANCDPVLVLNWIAPAAPRGIGGYSYTIVSQDDPLYDINRWPDERVELEATRMSFTTEPLDPGHIWEFNIRTVDPEGLASEFYSSFWAAIEPCVVRVISPKSSDSFAVGEWITIFWEPMSFDGNDVSGGYNVVLIELLDGSAVANSFTVNLANTLSAGFQVPVVNPGSDYRVRVTLDRNSAGDQIPGLPETFSGDSEVFSIINID